MFIGLQNFLGHCADKMGNFGHLSPPPSFHLVGLKDRALSLANSAYLSLRTGVWALMDSMPGLPALVAYCFWQMLPAHSCNMALLSKGETRSSALSAI